jgi:hypothetical protein
MKKRKHPLGIKGQKFTIAVGAGILFLTLVTSFVARIIRVKDIEIDFVLQRLEAQTKKPDYDPLAPRRVVIQRRLNRQIRPDLRCLSWVTTPVNHGWTQDQQDKDFFIDYYLPPDKKAIICTTPVLSAALIANRTKPFLYEVYPTEHGFRIRIIEGLSEVREPCQYLTGDRNCANALLLRQAIVRFEP